MYNVTGYNGFLEVVSRNALILHSISTYKAAYYTLSYTVELDASNARVSMAVSDCQNKQKEVIKLDKANRKLKEEVRALQEHIAVNMVSKSDMETYKKAIDDKVRKPTAQACMHIHVQYMIPL